MKHFLTISLVILLVTAIFIPNMLVAKDDKSPSKEKIIPAVIYVKFKPTGNVSVQSSSAYQSILQKYSVREVTQPFMRTAKSPSDEEFTRIFKMIIPATIDVMNAVKEIRNDPNIEYAEPSYIQYTNGYTPNDPSYASMYSLAKINASAAWDITKGDSTVVIGIVDTGTDYTHEDLAANIWTNPGETGTDNLARDKRTNGVDDDNNGFIDDWHGWDFVGGPIPVTSLAPDNDPHPRNGNPHGTHTAGTASAVTDNGKGVSSIGFNCKLMITKHGPDVAGSNSIYNGYDGILYCINNGANIVSVSWGGGGASQYYQDVIRYALKKNVTVVAAAGNGGADNEITPHYPSSYRGVLAVGASDSQDKKAGFSNYGKPEFVKVFAPGVDILSTVPINGYQSWNGTSMATPLVSGLAGLIKSKNPSWTAGQIMFQICGTADKIDRINPSFAGEMGYGRINAFRALTETPLGKPELAFIDYKINEVGGNGNGILEPGENAKLDVIVRNDWGDAQNLTATLSTTHWTTTITKSSSTYGLLRGISNIDSSQRGSLNDDFAISISADAIPQVIPFTVTFSASGGYTKQFNFSIALGLRLLLVDDDDGSVNVENYYTNALNSLGTIYDIWDHNKKGTPPASVLQNYQAVIWSCEWAFPSLDAADRTSISTYLNGGGKFFLSGQDVAWDLGDLTGTEFVASGGASKTFLETYLKAKYVNDDALNGSLQGVASDTIGNGLTIIRNQPGRASINQYPDVIDTTGGSVYSFKYSGGSFAGGGGAILYSKNYKLAFFGFGGFESITDSTKRVEVMERMLKWMFEYSLVVDKLPNTENTTTPYPIGAVVSTKSAVQNASLYWDTDGAFPFNKVTMTESAGKYSASIPAQTSGKNVEYFVLVKSATGFLPYLLSKFYVGPDVVPPVISVQTQDTLKNSIKLKGPFVLRAQITDNLGLDTTNIILHYAVNGGAESTVLMKRTATQNIYEGSIVFGNALTLGDSVSYYITVKDVASISNMSRYPAVGSKIFIVGKEIIDTFEEVRTTLWNFGNWGYSTRYRAAGSLQNITDSPTGNYPPNTNNILRLLQTYDLSEHTKAELQFHQKTFVHSSDTAFLEISRNGSDWIPVKKMNGIASIFGFPVKEFVNLNNFVGAGNEAVHMRFRLQSDGIDEAEGIYIDDIEILTGKYVTTGVVSHDNVTPNAFALQQNYPNPFNPSTKIQYSLEKAAQVSLKVYNVLGLEVATLVNGRQEAGSYTVPFGINKGTPGLSSGVYFYRLEAGSFVSTKKLILIK